MTELVPYSELGPYTILKLLRKGGMASIYLAEWRSDLDAEPVQVALKVANPVTDVASWRERPADSPPSFYDESLSNEVEILRKLRHPGIVHIFPIPWGIKRNPYIVRAANVASSPWFCAMEYLTGGSVAQLLEREGVLNVYLATEIAYQVTSALDYVHSKGYAHLDVKPDNLLLRHSLQEHARPEVVLIDFGISQFAPHGNVPAGSLPYMPPEQVMWVTRLAPTDSSPAGGAIDVYSVGVLLYKMLTGALPFGGRAQANIINNILNQEPVKASHFNAQISPSVDALIQRTLVKDPARRPTVSELVWLLDEAVPPPRFVEDFVRR
jgi:eukaryotic-like serine/threonine-protein kinase